MFTSKAGDSQVILPLTQSLQSQCGGAGAGGWGARHVQRPGEVRRAEVDCQEDHRPPEGRESYKRGLSVVAVFQFEPLSFENDLALLELEDPVEYKVNAIPACLPGDDDDLVGLRGWVTGWGITTEAGPLSHVLREVRRNY